MRPTGRLHLGHLVGALENWVVLQEKYECLFMVADWHALMSEYASPSNIISDSREMALDWLACGIDPKKSLLFVQSQVKEHVELFMALGIITPLGWLERCPTYKEQLREVAGRDLTTYGFLGYPVLQAADILLYKAVRVPVGEDQLPHLELAREMLRRFESLYKKAIFPEPQPLLTQVPKLLGTDNRKMSKSLNNYIALSDEPEVVCEKIHGMVTDPARIKKTDVGHPEVCTVHRYFEVFAKELAPQVADWCRKAKKGCMECKALLAERLNLRLSGIRKGRREIEGKRGYVEAVLEDGRQRAQKIAARTIIEAKEAMGFLC